MHTTIIQKMIEVNKNDPKRINHALKVFALTKVIAENEIKDPFKKDCALIAAVLHDIGIHAAEEKYHSNAGKYQEIEGPLIARRILEKLNYNELIIARVCFLIAKHHTFTADFGIDHQALIEADLIVNLNEENASESAFKGALDRRFKTETGKAILMKMIPEKNRL